MNRIIAAANTLCVCAAGFLVACDDETITIGIPSASDVVETATETFSLTTRSLRLDSVIANSTKSYLGEVLDPETGTDIKAEFLTQFYCFEDYAFPDEKRMVKSADGEIEADSVDLRLYFSTYYGLDNNPMKLQVLELDTANVISEGKSYYADMDLTQFVRSGSQPLTTKVFTPSDYSLPESDRLSTTYYNNVHIKLPRRYGSEILQRAVRQPNYLVNSWQFIHHICPGFYFKLISGKGTMLTIDVATLNIYFRYHDANTDTIASGYSRFSATAEVIQSTSIQNQGIDALLSRTDVPYTYLKSPAGIATEVTLPVDEIYQGHEGDSISRARVIMTRMNSETQNTQSLDTPSTLLLVTKARRHSFFTSRSVADNETAFTTSFDSNYNTYTFSNLSRLISYMHRQKQKGMAEEHLTSEQWNALYPDWNRVLLIPVSITTTTDSSTGTAKQVAVNHDFSLTSARLVGGTQPIQMQVIYSSYR
ncbi:MAG: DUF4270 domain-containing protein [Bacteroidaceae bacterium]|nr:DUF4270 domain-containing protein [Bacteroidaceae bacterium]